MNRILIAEDEQRIADFVEKGLRAEGFQTHAVPDGHAAVELARDFDLLILDLGLPGLDGFSVLRRIRADGSTFPSSSSRLATPLKTPSPDLRRSDDMRKPFSFR